MSQIAYGNEVWMRQAATFAFAHRVFSNTGSPAARYLPFFVEARGHALPLSPPPHDIRSSTVHKTFLITLV